MIRERLRAIIHDEVDCIGVGVATREHYTVPFGIELNLLIVEAMILSCQFLHINICLRYFSAKDNAVGNSALRRALTKVRCILDAGLSVWSASI